MLKLVTFPDNSLRKHTKTITKFDSRLKSLGDQMVELMKKEEGIGIAAQQCGLDISIIVCYNPDTHLTYIMCNPEIVRSEGKQTAKEGCLSFEGTWVEVERPQTLVVHYKDVKGKIKILKSEGLFARCIAHEVEHLKGILLIDSQDKKLGGKNEN